MENLIKWFSKNHVAGNFLMGAILLAGFGTWFSLRKEIMPEVAIDTVNISVPYPNATPEEVESGIVIPIEEAIADIDGIDEINSTASQSVGTVSAEISPGYDLREIMSDIKTKVDAIDNLAEEAEEPVITELVIRTQVLSIALSADTDEKTLRNLAEKVRDELLSYEKKKKGFFDFLRPDQSITQVELVGVRPYEISIEVKEETLKELDMTLGQIAQAVRTSSLDLPGGSIDTDAGEVIIRASSKRYTAEEFRNIPVVTKPDGSTLLLSDIATVIDGFEEAELSNTFDGKPAVLVDVYRVGQQDTLILARAAKEYVETAQQTLPEGVTLQVWNDFSLMLEGRLSLLARNGIIGISLVLIVLALFLRPSLAILVAIGIPVSFAGGIWMMPTVDISINMISLFAFILVLGVVVDDAIVVGENVYTRIQEGMPPKEAAWKGSHEVGVIVIFGVLTTAMAFTPMLGIDGVSGKYWRNIPLIVIPTLLFSLVQSKLVLPSHLAFLSPSSRDKKTRNPLLRLQRAISNGLERFIQKIYTPFLDVCLRSRYIVLALFLFSFFLIVGLVGGNRIKFVFFPKVEGDILTANLELAPGTPYIQTVKSMDKLEEALKQVSAEYKDFNGEPIVKHYVRSDGTQSLHTSFAIGGFPIESNIGQFVVELAPANSRDVLSREIASRWRELVGSVPGAVELTFKSETAGGGNAIDINLIGPDLTQLEAASAYSRAELAKVVGTIDINDSNREGKRELQFRELTPTGTALGFTLEEVIRQVRWAFYGNEVQRIQRGKDDLKVMVRLPREERLSIENMEQLRLRSPLTGAEVPLLQVAIPKEDSGLSSIQRIGRQRSIKVSADVNPALANQTDVQNAFTGSPAYYKKSEKKEKLEKMKEEGGVKALLAHMLLKKVDVPQKGILQDMTEKFPSVRFTASGEVKDRNDSVSQIAQGYLIALIGMFVMMAIPLKSYVKPLIVMSVIPFGIVGAVIGHVIMGMDLSIMSMCGIAALSGVVVNDSLVLVDFVSRYEKEYGKLEAARRAGAARFRAITLTSLTTFVGIMPMVTETDMQAKFLIPMAISLGFGILFATLITLILVPSVYLILEDIKGLFKWRQKKAVEEQIA